MAGAGTGELPAVAFVLVGIGDLSGGGGAERFFAEAFEAYQELEEARYELYLITDESSLARLRQAGRALDSRLPRVVAAPAGCLCWLSLLAVSAHSAPLRSTPLFSSDRTSSRAH